MKNVVRTEMFRELPSVDELVRTRELAALAKLHGAAAVTDAARDVLARLRNEISSGLLDEAGLRLALTGMGAAV